MSKKDDRAKSYHLPGEDSSATQAARWDFFHDCILKHEPEIADSFEDATLHAFIEAVPFSRVFEWDQVLLEPKIYAQMYPEFTRENIEPEKVARIEKAFRNWKKRYRSLRPFGEWVIKIGYDSVTRAMDNVSVPIAKVREEWILHQSARLFPVDAPKFVFEVMSYERWLSENPTMREFRPGTNQLAKILNNTFDWNPSLAETSDEAIERVTEAFRTKYSEHLDRISAYAESFGLVSKPGEKRKKDRDFTWFYQHKVENWKYQEIAERFTEETGKCENLDTVRKAVERTAQLLNEPL